MMTEQLKQSLSIPDKLNYQSVDNTSVNTGGLDMSKFRRSMYIVQAHSVGAAGTIDGRLQSSANSNFNVVANVTNSNLTQMTANNKLSTVEVRADQIEQQNPGHRYVRLQLTGAGNAVTLSAIGIGAEAIQKPANGNDSADVVSRTVVE